MEEPTFENGGLGEGLPQVVRDAASEAVDQIAKNAFGIEDNGANLTKVVFDTPDHGQLAQEANDVTLADYDPDVAASIAANEGEDVEVIDEVIDSAENALWEAIALLTKSFETLSEAYDELDAVSVRHTRQIESLERALELAVNAGFVASVPLQASVRTDNQVPQNGKTTFEKHNEHLTVEYKES